MSQDVTGLLLPKWIFDSMGQWIGLLDACLHGDSFMKIKLRNVLDANSRSSLALGH